MFLTITLCTDAKLNFFKIELIICLKMDLALNSQQGWYAIKPKQPSNICANIMIDFR